MKPFKRIMKELLGCKICPLNGDAKVPHLHPCGNRSCILQKKRKAL